ncbi:hypothetical protein GOP47_0028588, partial [Adiantum capillus-veneris]
MYSSLTVWAGLLISFLLGLYFSKEKSLMGVEVKGRQQLKERVRGGPPIEEAVSISHLV